MIPVVRLAIGAIITLNDIKYFQKLELFANFTRTTYFLCEAMPEVAGMCKIVIDS